MTRSSWRWVLLGCAPRLRHPPAQTQGGTERPRALGRGPAAVRTAGGRPTWSGRWSGPGWGRWSGWRRRDAAHVLRRGLRGRSSPVGAGRTGRRELPGGARRHRCRRDRGRSSSCWAPLLPSALDPTGSVPWAGPEQL
ncbi:hypothetical protein [Ornithinimicrobium kibberense]|uniref:hypothetical protein n=1 Tax=Ornithinimicrobium kibberense TaxID=282060 RepID=UPI00360F6604